MIARRSSTVPADSASQLGSAAARRPKSPATASLASGGASARSEIRLPSPSPCSSASTAISAPKMGIANTNESASDFSLPLSRRRNAIGSKAAA